MDIETAELVLALRLESEQLCTVGNDGAVHWGEGLGPREIMASGSLMLNDRVALLALWYATDGEDRRP